MFLNKKKKTKNKECLPKGGSYNGEGRIHTNGNISDISADFTDFFAFPLLPR